MKINIWNWFVNTWAKLIGNAVNALTANDGEEGLSWKDVQIAVQYIKEAEVKFGTGEERRAWVLEQLKKARQIVLPHLVELLFWVALNYSSQKGFIKLGDGADKISIK